MFCIIECTESVVFFFCFGFGGLVGAAAQQSPVNAPLLLLLWETNLNLNRNYIKVY